MGPVEITKALVRINSENFSANEIQAGEYCRKILEPIGFQIFEEPMTNENINLICVLPFDGKLLNFENVTDYRFLMFSGHLDTVPGYEHTNARLAMEKDGKIFGRGASDMKSGIAAFISAISKTEFPKNQATGIVVGLTVREELGCEGVRYLKSELVRAILNRVEFCVLAEPSENTPIVGHNGINSYIVKFHGRSCHSGKSYLGDSAIYKAGKFLVDLEKYYQELQTREVEIPELGKPQISAGLIKGGTQINIVPDLCEISIDRRLVPGEDDMIAASEVKEIARKYDKNAEFEVIEHGKPYIFPQNNEKQRNFLSFLKKETSSELCYLPAYTEAEHYYTEFGIPTVIIGPGTINVAHTDEEYVKIVDLFRSVELYQTIIERFTNGNFF